MLSGKHIKVFFMTTELKKKEYILETLPRNTAHKLKRPNIDHLLKRIIIEKKKEKNKILLASVIILMTVSLLMLFSLYN